MTGSDPHSDGKLWVMPAILEVFGFSSVLKAFDTFDAGKPWFVWFGYAATGTILLAGGIVWAVFRKRIAELWPWLVAWIRSPKKLAAALAENASLKEELDISRREKIQQNSELYKAVQCLKISDDENRAMRLQIEELKANSSGQLSLQAPQAQGRLIKPQHNVQYVGFKLIPDDPFTIAALCFQNVPIPGQLMGKFEYPRLRAIYYENSTGQEIADMGPLQWWNFEHNFGEIAASE
jgi:hypothetical protein